MPDIQNTEAEIVEGRHSATARITKLAGDCTFEPYMKLFTPTGFVGLSFIGTKTGSSVICNAYIRSGTEGFKLSKGDMVTFHLEDGSFIPVKFNVAANKFHGVYSNLASLTPNHLDFIERCPIDKISLTNKTGTVDAHFKPSEHYTTKGQGQKLIDLMLQRVMGAFLEYTPSQGDPEPDILVDILGVGFGRFGLDEGGKLIE